MKRLILFLLMATSTLIAEGQATESKDILQVKAALAAQKEAWNQGDIEAFMASYWNSPDLQFINSQGVIKGWQGTLERYQQAYPDQEAMGKLDFQILNTDLRAKKLVTMSGKYILTRDNKNIVGYFTLVWKKFGKNWLIVMDTTT